MDSLFFDRKFYADEAMHDKVSFDVTHNFAFWKDKETMSKIIKHLGEYDEKRHGRVKSFTKAQKKSGWIFTRSEREGKVGIRKRNTKTLPKEKIITKPIFGGSYVVKSVARDFEQTFSTGDGNDPNSYVNFHIDGNISRFMHHHVFPVPSKLYLAHQRKAPLLSPWRNYLLLTKRVASPSLSDEYSYDKDDNWVPSKHGIKPSNVIRMENLPSSKRCREAEKSYFPLIVDALSYEWKRATEQAKVDVIEGKPNFSLTYLETYWELPHNDPVSFVKNIQPQLDAFNKYSAEKHKREFKNDNDESRLHRSVNSISLVMRLRSGIEIAIYAKTNKRIRFEIRHYFRSKTKGKATHVLKSGRYSTNSLFGIQSRMKELREDASKRINIFFSYLKERLDPIPINESETTMELIKQFYKSSDSADLASEMLKVLANNDKILSMAHYNDVRKSLVKAGVLKHIEGGAYTVTDRYRRALEGLKKACTVAFEAPRKRIRRLRRNSQPQRQES